ncbi:MAG: hypothetical protein Ct9H300mP1_13320 [Planctomycetaceae bacterium]|nr:MAG: hypothetical protein Ct9H300mP1_13320 [Planctomycetaceae bacterium]
MLRLEIHATNDGGAPKLDDLEAWTPAGDPKQPSRNVALAELGAVASSSSFAMANQSRLAENLIDGARKLNFFWQAARAGRALDHHPFDKPRAINRSFSSRWAGGAGRLKLQVPDGPNRWRRSRFRDRMLHPSDRRSAEKIRSRVPGRNRPNPRTHRPLRLDPGELNGWPLDPRGSWDRSSPPRPRIA